MPYLSFQFDTIINTLLLNSLCPIFFDYVLKIKFSQILRVIIISLHFKLFLMYILQCYGLLFKLIQTRNLSIMFKFIKVHKFIKVREFINLCLKIDLIHAEFFSLLFVLDFKDFALDSSYLFVCILTPALLYVFA